MFTPVIQEYHSTKSPWEVYQNLYRSSEVSFFLDSIRYRLPDQRYSYFAKDPFLEVVIPPSHNGGQPCLYVSGEISLKEPAIKLFGVLRYLMKKYRVRHKGTYPFFTGGAVGYWGYELATLFEKVSFRKKPAWDLPWLHLGFFRDLIVYDHLKKHYFLVTHQSPKPTPDEKLRSHEAIHRLKDCFDSPRQESGEEFCFRRFRAEIPQRKFESMVRRAKEYIAAGDIYQANLSQRFAFECDGSRLKLYSHLRKINPSPFASFFKIRDLEIISSSPERLIRKRGRDAETRPIAGTRPRREGRRTSVSLERELLASDKERAEHIMLVDLERNDLGRVCQWKTVRVEEMMAVEKYSHVLHIVSKVVGRLGRGKDGLDLIRAMFPGGTITGCPKVRCMQIIDELEPVRRGIYTGSIGYIDFHGNLDLNIVIRTLVLVKNKGHLQVGAGIVYDSDPRREYEETIHKGEALAQALMESSS